MCKELKDEEVINVTGGTSELSGNGEKNLIADYLTKNNLLIGEASEDRIKETVGNMTPSQLIDLKKHVFIHRATNGYNTEKFLTDILDTIK